MKWVRVPLADLSETIDYGVTASAKFNEGNVKFLRITDIQDNTVNWTTVPYCDAPSKKVANALLRDGDIVFARTGATTGKSYLLKRPPKNVVFASYLIRVRPSPKVDSDYLNHFFNTPDYWRQIKAKAQGAAQEGVNATKLSSLEIPLPPLDEQKRIAAILDKADALRRQRRQALALLDSLTQSIFLEMFGDPAKNPSNWKLCRLEKVVDAIVDCPHSTPHWVSTGKIALRTSNLTKGGWNWSDTRYVSDGEFVDRSQRRRVKPRDIVLSREGTVGIAAIVEAGMEVCLGQRLVQIVPDEKISVSEYLLHHLLFELDPKRISRVMVGATSRHINVKDLRALKIMMPPLDRQIEFRRRCKAITFTLEGGEASAKTMQFLFASLQHRAFSGQL